MVETLTNALESFTKVEVIEDVMCDGCKSRVNMEKYLKIEQAPEVLVIHLKRFLNSGHDILKILGKVKYTLELDIAPFMCSIDDVSSGFLLFGYISSQAYVC
jgi:ubiquitin carboxyl-terminal hydrolase 36/42